MRKDKEKRGISLRGRLIAAFLLFTAAVLVVLWLFETVLLDDIYRSLKLRDIDKCAEVNDVPHGSLQNHSRFQIFQT